MPIPAALHETIIARPAFVSDGFVYFCYELFTGRHREGLVEELGSTRAHQQ
jgi:hypothetical protein